MNTLKGILRFVLDFLKLGFVLLRENAFLIWGKLLNNEFKMFLGLKITPGWIKIMEKDQFNPGQNFGFPLKISEITP